MADVVCLFGKGAVMEMVRDSVANLLILLLKGTPEADLVLSDHADVAALLVPAANVEAIFTSYARKTAITGTLTEDTTNDRVDLDIPDQTWSPAGNGANDTLAKLVVAYENAAADATRVPVSHHDFAVTTDGSDLTALINAAGIIRAQQ